MDFEDDLRMALRREQPSPDFTARVMERIAQLPAPLPEKQETKQEKVRKKRNWKHWQERFANVFQLPQFKWAMAGAMAVAMIAVAVGVNLHQAHQREMAELIEGQKAKEQVMLAMRIASAKLNVAQRKVHETSERESDK